MSKNTPVLCGDLDQLASLLVFGGAAPTAAHAELARSHYAELGLADAVWAVCPPLGVPVAAAAALAGADRRFVHLSPASAHTASPLRRALIAVMAEAGRRGTRLLECTLDAEDSLREGVLSSVGFRVAAEHWELVGPVVATVLPAELAPCEPSQWGRLVSEVLSASDGEALALLGVSHAQRAALLTSGFPEHTLEGAQLGNPLRGFALLAHSAGEARLLFCAVHPAHRGKGHGQSLLAWAHHQANGRGARVMRTLVRADNPAALALYGRAGLGVQRKRRQWHWRPAPPEEA